MKNAANSSPPILTDKPSATRDRLLLAAAQLLAESGDRTASTRAICARAGVQAPTLYHHFGSKQGLIDAVINHGFTQYVRAGERIDPSDDPIASIRAGWDRHVQFGLEHPSFYALLYGQIEPGKPCAITGPARGMLVELLTLAARAGQLRVPPTDAAAQVLAANVGVTLALIAQPEGETDLALSTQVREAILVAVLTRQDASGTGEPPARTSSRAEAAIVLVATIDEDDSGLSAGEAMLLRELLDRLSAR